jgi:phosphohistidine phosphatase
MKTLLLMRHGKSSWKDAALADHDRPLKMRGRRAASQVGRLLVNERLAPDLILTSTAVRAQDTAVLMAEAANYRGAIETVTDLYHADHSAFVACVSQAATEFETVLVVGHNPGLEEWLTQLTGARHEFPTAALAHIELSIENWSDLTLTTSGTLRNVWRPRELANESG